MLSIKVLIVVYTAQINTWPIAYLNPTLTFALTEDEGWSTGYIGVPPPWNKADQYSLIKAFVCKAKQSWFTVYRSHPHVFLGTEHNFIIHYSSLYNHFPASIYVWAVFTAKITVWRINGMMVYPLGSSKIVSKLSGVSTKSQRMHKQDVW